MCTVPLGAPACDVGGVAQDNQCTTIALDLSCQPFVVGLGAPLSWFCDKAVGAGLPGTACVSGGQCRSGFCGSNGTCFRACVSAVDCPQNPGTGKHYRCGTVDITDEGVTESTGSCIP
jgi:hypothetical protein